MPTLKKSSQAAPSALESILLDDEALDHYLCEIIQHGRSESARITAEKRLRQVRRDRKEELLADKAWPVPETREQYKERLVRILQACGQSLTEEALQTPDLWTHDAGLT